MTRKLISFVWLICLFLSACGDAGLKPEAVLWGEWAYAGGEGGDMAYAHDLHFQEDGSLALLGRTQDLMSYVVIAPGRMKITFNQQSEILNYVLSDDTLELSFNQGSNRYQRQSNPPSIIANAVEFTITHITPTEVSTPSPTTSAPTSTATIGITQTPTTGITPTIVVPTEEIIINKTDPQAVFEWVKLAIEKRDASLFGDLVPDQGVWYNDLKIDSSGFVLKTKQDFLQDLQNHLAAQPECEGVHLDEGQMVVWFRQWQPGWQASLIDPTNAALAFTLQPDGYQLTDILLYPPLHYFNFSMAAAPKIYTLIACDSEDMNNPSYVPSCPGSLPQRMEVGQRGRICTLSDKVRMRVKPGLDGAVRRYLLTGTTFEVINGPECAGNNWSWWQIRLDDGQVGWLAEGGDEFDLYFICPLD